MICYGVIHVIKIFFEHGLAGNKNPFRGTSFGFMLFRDLVGVGIGPVSKKLAVKYSFFMLKFLIAGIAIWVVP